MNALDHLATKLDQHPHIHYERTSESISVEPGDESGFRGEFRVKDVRFTVSFDGWHEEFTSEDEALGC